MAMKKLGRQFKGDYEKFKFENVGDVLEGEYQGSETFDFEGKALTSYKFKNNAGKTVSTIGGTRLNELLPLIPVGAFTRIEFTEVKRTKRGGTLKEFDVSYEESGL